MTDIYKHKSSVFDARSLNFVRSLIYGIKPPSVFSQSEQQLVARRDEVVRLNGALDGRLVVKLIEAKDCADVIDFLVFLLDSQKMGKLDEAVYVSDIAIRDERVLDSQVFAILLENANEMPMSWTINLYGEHVEHNKPVAPKPSIDLDRLRDFQ